MSPCGSSGGHMCCARAVQEEQDLLQGWSKRRLRKGGDSELSVDESGRLGLRGRGC